MILPTTFSFTDKNIKKIKPQLKTKTYSDTKLGNLKLVVTPNETKTFYVRFKLKGTPQSFNLGRANELTVTNARSRAIEYMNLKRGQYSPPPQLPIQTALNNQTDVKSDYTLGDAYNAYFENHLKHKKTSGGRIHGLANAWELHLKEDLTEIPVQSLTRKWIAKYMKSLFQAKTYSIHNKCVTILKASLNYCLIYEEDYPLEFNPASLLKKEATVVRERYLSFAEVKRLLAELQALNHYNYTDLFTLALFTGARIGNIRAMKWEEIDFIENIWTVPAVKTKTNTTYYLPLSTQARSILKTRKKQHKTTSPFVFPTPTKSSTGHTMGGDNVWKEVIKKAGLYSTNKDIRIRKHDLRRTFATWQILKGVDILTVSKTLGHTDIKCTQIYARINTDKAKQAVDIAFQDLL